MSFDLAAFRAAQSGGRPALHWQGRWYSYAELDDRASRLAGRLHAIGLGGFERVAILAHNHLAHIDLMLATAKAGVVYAPLNPRLGAAELDGVVRMLRPGLLLHDADHADAAAASGLPLQPLEGYEDWLGRPAPAPDPTVGPDDPQMILLTGGTTGLPKGAVLPYRQVAGNAAATVLSWGLREDDAAVQATPCFHAALNALSTPLLYAGGRIALLPRFEPGAYLQAMAEVDASLMFMVPTMYRMLAEHPGFAQADLSRLRWAISGGAPCPMPLQQVFARRGLRFRQGYGLTEAGVNCFAIPQEVADRKPWSVGRPILHMRAVVRRADGQACGVDEVGELTLAGPQVFSGYFERPEATADALQDGWLWTGDLARVDADGDFALVGRRKEMFISGGENVYPAEVAAALEEHPKVAGCAVVAVADERWGEVGLAAVVPRGPLPEGGEAEAMAAELRAFLAQRLARYKVPKHLRFMPSLPLSGAGKVLGRALREAFEAEADGAGSGPSGSSATDAGVGR